MATIGKNRPATKVERSMKNSLKSSFGRPGPGYREDVDRKAYKTIRCGDLQCVITYNKDDKNPVDWQRNSHVEILNNSVNDTAEVSFSVDQIEIGLDAAINFCTKHIEELHLIADNFEKLREQLNRAMFLGPDAYFEDAEQKPEHDLESVLFDENYDK